MISRETEVYLFAQIRLIFKMNFGNDLLMYIHSSKKQICGKKTVALTLLPQYYRLELLDD